MQSLRALFSFNGRTSRLAYWRTQLWTSVVLVAIWIVTIFVAMGAGDIAVIPMLFGLPVLVINLAVLVRRLHDRGKDARWLLVFWAAPSACFVAAQLATDQTGEGGAFALASAMAGLAFEAWAIVEVGFLRGTPGPNRFGPAPPSGLRRRRQRS
jgi:uncharacterized membrane protein YhaH (DUF805 family)